MNPWSGKHRTHLVTKTWLPDALLRAEPAARRPLVVTEIRRKPEFPQRVGRDAHTHLVTTNNRLFCILVFIATRVRRWAPRLAAA